MLAITSLTVSGIHRSCKCNRNYVYSYLMAQPDDRDKQRLCICVNLVNVKTKKTYSQQCYKRSQMEHKSKRNFKNYFKFLCIQFQDNFLSTFEKRKSDKDNYNHNVFSLKKQRLRIMYIIIFLIHERNVFEIL